MCKEDKTTNFPKFELHKIDKHSCYMVSYLEWEINIKFILFSTIYGSDMLNNDYFNNLSKLNNSQFQW